MIEAVKEVAKAASLPRLNEPAPAFEAVTTQGTLRLSDYEGSWLILFSHPADFTPVCTTEFRAFAEIYPRAAEAQCSASGPEHRQRLFAHRLDTQHRRKNRHQDPVSDHRRPQ